MGILPQRRDSWLSLSVAGSGMSAREAALQVLATVVAGGIGGRMLVATGESEEGGRPSWAPLFRLRVVALDGGDDAGGRRGTGAGDEADEAGEEAADAATDRSSKRARDPDEAAPRRGSGDDAAGEEGDEEEDGSQAKRPRKPTRTSAACSGAPAPLMCIRGAVGCMPYGCLQALTARAHFRLAAPLSRYHGKPVCACGRNYVSLVWFGGFVGGPSRNPAVRRTRDQLQPLEARPASAGADWLVAAEHKGKAWPSGRWR